MQKKKNTPDAHRLLQRFTTPGNRHLRQGRPQLPIFHFRPFLWFVMTLLALPVRFYLLASLFFEGIGTAALEARVAAFPFAATAHLLGGAVALLLGPFQINRTLRTTWLPLHRRTGRVYLVAVIAGGLGSLYLSTTSEGGPLAQLGSALLAGGWLFTGMMAYISIRTGHVGPHRQWMLRNFALTYAAVSAIILQPLFFEILHLSPVAGAALLAWLCWLPNAAVAESLILLARRRAAKRATSEIPF